MRDFCTSRYKLCEEDFMCTAITYKTKDHYFGRTLDLEYTYDERVTVTPRKFRFEFRNGRVT